MAQVAVSQRKVVAASTVPWSGLALALLGAGLLAVPFLGVAPFTVTLLTEALIFAIWAMSLDLLLGYTGLVSFGHAAGFGLATYAAGYFAREVTADFVLALLVAQVTVVAVAGITGFVATRVSGVAFAILTLAISQVLFQIAVAWREVTDGMDGLVGVPLPTLFGWTVEPGTHFYLLTAGLLIAVYITLRWLVDSPFGRTLQAIRANESRAAAIGVNVRLHKWLVFVLSWSVAGVAGTLFVFMKAGTTPLVLYWRESGYVLAMTIFGGLGTLVGPVVGAIGFVFLRDEVVSRFQAWQFAFGTAFVLAVILFPRGLAGIVLQLRSLVWPARS